MNNEQTIIEQTINKKVEKDGYKIIIDKNGKQRYQKIQDPKRAQEIKAQKVKLLKEKAIPALKIKSQMNKTEQKQTIHDAHSIDREEIKTIRERLDELKNIVKSVVKTAEPTVNRTQSAPKEQQPLQQVQTIKEMAERPIIPQAPKKYINPNLAKYGIH